MIPSAPRPTDCMERASICPGALGAFARREFADSVACSITSHGTPGFSDRMRSRVKADSNHESGSLGSG